jgi:enoyl-CoA hydratase/carnithine racemase
VGEFFEVAMDGHVALVTLSRPPVNAMSRAVMTELRSTFAALEHEPTARAIVLTGGRQRFSAGVDIRELRDAPPDDAIPRNALFQAIFLEVERHRLPVIAAVNGYALGGGCELAMACDIRVAAQDAFFAVPEIALGGLPGIGGMQRLQRLVGLGKAKQLVLTGDRITAPQAHQIGLVDELAPAGEAIDAAFDLARRIAAKPPLSVQAGKKALNLGRDIPLEQAQAIDLRFCGEIAGTQDRAESLAAFLEKRQPRLVGH